MTGSFPDACDNQTVAVWRSVSALRQSIDGSNLCGSDVAEETPLALHYNGIPHAVMMGTPLDLEDFAVGFSIAEDIATNLDDLRAVETTPREDGIAIAISLAPEALHRFLGRRRVRSLRGHTSCGICGIEDLEQLTSIAMRRVPAACPIDRAALEIALVRLRGFQPLGSLTHGAHAAAWVSLDGTLLLVREDVGRHNALDKLVGAALRGGYNFSEGFCLITSRCSYEMVQKAVAAHIPALVAISAPTALAIRTAQAAGLTLVTLDRSGGHLVYASPQGAASSPDAHRQVHEHVHEHVHEQTREGASP
jgi:FdhD protein